jgi:hypothetical protein
MRRARIVKLAHFLLAMEYPSAALVICYVSSSLLAPFPVHLCFIPLPYPSSWLVPCVVTRSKLGETLYPSFASWGKVVVL